ncbi:hypothetical protein SAM23877_p040 (plasmid) [Streptomyces ambofaciens ATCC 23877]|uniref:Uncharacterized protein n=1 Tax=Streptomyces ambofaciens (strain ATCC 23877 / 3486 / DSM 40053 / JCM 4204 / NBRC 12836 / NRRL B-2516) TaxID=278992 RepID=A0A0K2B648_STRA7|nr:hypothetical protein [Streptomyces ambofaciens]AKZ60749.1 hypothetical protein SAM23877_p040 [Streptomyces ambofaciens ATCC 23877]
MEDALARIRHQITDTTTTVLNDLDTIEDPVQRQQAARTVLEELLPDMGREIKAHRSRTVAGLKEGRTLKQVAEMIGSSIALVDQLIKSGKQNKQPTLGKGGK